MKIEERFIKELAKHLLDYLKNLICITEVVPQDLYILSDIHLLKIIIFKILYYMEIKIVMKFL